MHTATAAAFACAGAVLGVLVGYAFQLHLYLFTDFGVVYGKKNKNFDIVLHHFSRIAATHTHTSPPRTLVFNALLLSVHSCRLLIGALLLAPRNLTHVSGWRYR